MIRSLKARSRVAWGGKGSCCLGRRAGGLQPRRVGQPLGRPGAAVFWLGERNWFGHLGASSDRDFASPGLLGVRWDGPAGGSTWGGRTAGRRPADGGATYVSAPLPLLGAWGAKSSRWVPWTLLVPSYRAGSARYFGAKNGQGTFLRVDLEQVSFGSLLGEEGRL